MLTLAFLSCSNYPAFKSLINSLTISRDVVLMGGDACIAVDIHFDDESQLVVDGSSSKNLPAIHVIHDFLFADTDIRFARFFRI